ncbi:MAG: LytTR family DNA-binding domain-containing protein [Peptococcaceae bacterium]|nr:LytTR family DNA-binding domain-containing protein [Peptococcaceae bacterium]
MKIVICDDSPSDAAELRAAVESHSQAHEVRVYERGRDFLTAVEEGVAMELVFLDVQLPDADGWDLAKALKKLRPSLFVAMVTVHGEYIFDCFDRVDWFAPKPVSAARVHRIIDAAEERLHPQMLTLTLPEKIEAHVPMRDILYVEVQRNHTTVHTGARDYQIRTSLKQLRQALAAYPAFTQCHASFLVNLDYYQRLGKDEIVLADGTRLKLTRTYRKAFMDALAAHLRRGMS